MLQGPKYGQEFFGNETTDLKKVYVKFVQEFIHAEEQTTLAFYTSYEHSAFCALARIYERLVKLPKNLNCVFMKPERLFKKLFKSKQSECMIEAVKMLEQKYKNLEWFELHNSEIRHDLKPKRKSTDENFPFLINPYGVSSLYKTTIDPNQYLNTICVGDIRKTAKVYVCMELGGCLETGKQIIQLAAYIPESGVHSEEMFYEAFAPQETCF